jgi:hypothetical protein
MNIYAEHYTTSDEIAFLTGLLTGKAHALGADVTHGWSGRGVSLQGFRSYAKIVLDDMRTYPDTVDVPRIKAWIRAALADMPAAAPPAVLAPDGDMDGAAE